MVVLGTTIHEFVATSTGIHDSVCMAAWLYIMSNRPNGTLYIGVTTNIAARAWQHRTGAVSGFTSKYKLTMLVYVESHDSIDAAIRRERTLKTWRRAWKVRLITEANPNWDDLYDRLLL
jgi:putative endonuclease